MTFNGWVQVLLFIAIIIAITKPVGVFMTHVFNDVEKLQAENPGKPVPIDLVTTSASGLDPHISPAAAEFQVPRVARERGVPEEQLRRIVTAHTEGRQFGFLGEPRVNVLELNLDLDQSYPMKR